MCELKSCLVLKDRVFCPDYDSHQKMLEELKIEDNETNALKTFVRVEFTPPDGAQSLTEPLDKWTLKVDQDMRPDWWDKAAYRPMIEEAVEAWRKEHVFADGKHEVTDGLYYAIDRATVRAIDRATVRASDSATVEAYSSATVRASDSATVEAYGSATVWASDSATVEAYSSATVRAIDRATVRAIDRATVRASGSATVRASDSATVWASDRATVRASGRATVWASDSATVWAIDSATVIWPLLHKIIYPAGWTAETHN